MEQPTNGSLRPPLMESPPGAETAIDGRRYLYFGGTGYLGLAGHPEVIEAACEATRRYGIHTATSRRGYGNNPPTLEVERLAAYYFGTEASFYFSSGYVANHILGQAVRRPSSMVFVDEAAHYCVLEASRLLESPAVTFRHRDPDDLARRIRISLQPGHEPLVLCDGVSPVTGALAPVKDYIQVLETFDSSSMLLDDAHGFGVVGPHGRGTLEHLGLWGPSLNSSANVSGVGLFVCGTLAKALGGFGGIIPGSREFIDVVRSSSHYFDGASAPASPVAGATAKALEIILREPELRQRLGANSFQLRQGLHRLGLAVEDWPTAICGVQIGDAANMQRIHVTLKSMGFLLPYVAVYPGIGHEGMLRFAVCATHTPAMIEQLLDGLRTVL
jgi:8-amino-7-oxononanoate synthase